MRGGVVVGSGGVCGVGRGSSIRTGKGGGAKRPRTDTLPPRSAPAGRGRPGSAPRVRDGARVLGPLEATLVQARPERLPLRRRAPPHAALASRPAQAPEAPRPRAPPRPARRRQALPF